MIGAEVAQSVEHWTENPGVASSILALGTSHTVQSGTIAGGSGSVGRASPCQGEGRGFESRLPLHFYVRLGSVATDLLAWGTSGAPSSSGRTADFGSVNRGSNPRGAASRQSGGDVPEWFRERSAKPRTRVRFPSSPPPIKARDPLGPIARAGRVRLLSERGPGDVTDLARRAWLVPPLDRVRVDAEVHRADRAAHGAPRHPTGPRHPVKFPPGLVRDERVGFAPVPADVQTERH